MKTLLLAFRPLAVDFLATIIFVATLAFTHNLMLATAVAIGVGVLQIIVQLVRKQRVMFLQWAALGLVIVLGGAGLITNDPRFLMFKPTIIYTVIGASMLQPAWLSRYMPPISRGRTPHSAVLIAGYGWAALMFVTAIANALFALYTSTATWAAFLAIFPTISKLIAFAITYVGMRWATLRAVRAAAAAPPAESAAATP